VWSKDGEGKFGLFLEYTEGEIDAMMTMMEWEKLKLLSNKNRD